VAASSIKIARTLLANNN